MPRVPLLPPGPMPPVLCPLPPGLAWGYPMESHPKADGRYLPPGAGREAWAAQHSRVGCSSVSPDPAVHGAQGGTGLSTNTQGTISPFPSTMYPSPCGHGGGRSWRICLEQFCGRRGSDTVGCSYAFCLGGFSLCTLCSLAADMEARLDDGLGMQVTVGSPGVEVAPGVGLALSGADVVYVGLLLAESPWP